MAEEIKISALDELTETESEDLLAIVDESNAETKKIKVGTLDAKYKPITTKGDIIIHDGATGVRLPIGANNRVLTADSSQSAGARWAELPAPPTYNELSPTTTKGDVVVNNGTGNVRLPVGANDYVLVADDGTSEGIKWAPSPALTTFDGLAPTTTKGDAIFHDGDNNIRIPVGTDDQVLVADDSEPAGVKWSDLPAPPTYDSLAPTTTKGDLIVHDGDNNIRIPVGSDDQVLVADNTEPAGVKWAEQTGTGSGDGLKNYVSNGDFNDGIQDWSATGDATLSQETANPLEGDGSLKITSTGTASRFVVSGEVLAIDTVYNGILLDASCAIKTSAGVEAEEYTVEVYNVTDSATVGGTLQDVLPGTYFYDFRFVPVAGKTYEVRVRDVDGTSGDELLVDLVRIGPDPKLIVPKASVDSEGLVKSNRYKQTYSADPLSGALSGVQTIHTVSGLEIGKTYKVMWTFAVNTNAATGTGFVKAELVHNSAVLDITQTTSVRDSTIGTSRNRSLIDHIFVATATTAILRAEAEDGTPRIRHSKVRIEEANNYVESDDLSF